MNTEIIKIDINVEKFEAEIEYAAKIIKNGGLVVFPTETVYGLGANGIDPEAALKIYEAKGRPSDNPLIIHIADPKEAERYAVTSPLYYELASRFMPGPITVVMKAREIVPLRTRANLPTVAVRCPENPIARRLIEASGVPIAAPSANLSGSPSPTSAKHVIDDMMGRVDLIIDGGDSDFGLESTIVKIEEDGSLTLLRPGKITAEELSEFCDKVVVSAAVTEGLKEGEIAISPGMKYRHYAPKSPVLLLDGDTDKCIEYIRSRYYGKNIAILAYTSDCQSIKLALPDAYVYEFGDKENEELQAHALFNILRDADKRDFDTIFAPLPRREGIGLALYNRMIRAAAYKIIRM